MKRFNRFVATNGTDATHPGLKSFRRLECLIVSALHNTHHSHLVVTLCAHSLWTWTWVRGMRSSCSTAACAGGPSDPRPHSRLMTSDYNRLHGSQNQLTHTLLHTCRRAHVLTHCGGSACGALRVGEVMNHKVVRPVDQSDTYTHALIINMTNSASLVENVGQDWVMSHPVFNWKTCPHTHTRWSLYVCLFVWL